MQSDEKQYFESEMKKNTALNESVLLQQYAIETIHLNRWKKQARLAYGRYHLMQQLKKWAGLSGVILAVMIGIWLAFFSPGNRARSVSALLSVKESATPANNTPYVVTHCMAAATLDIPLQIPAGFKVKTLSFHINPSQDTVLLVNNLGTRLHIAKNTFVDENGMSITTPVDISIREYINSAEIAFSQIPMVYHENGQEYRFNSAGMVEIQGKSNGRNIKIVKNKPIKMDYRLARKLPNTNFYTLDRNKEWKLLQKNIGYAPDKFMADSTTTINEQDLPFEEATVSEISQEFGQDTIIVGKTREQLMRERGVVNNNNGINKQKNTVNNVIPKNVGTLISIPGDPGHTYPDLVRGLNIETFGVYNCDQVYRIQNLVSITPVFTDEKGAVISNPWLVSMIDLDYNGAFSFGPGNFLCNPNGKTVLLLFTRSNQLYALSKNQFNAMHIKQSGRYTFKMQNCTEKIRSTADLSKFLELKQ
jgi:hypothetical protein